MCVRVCACLRVSSDESTSERKSVFSALTHAGGDRNTVTMVTDDVLPDPPLPICVPLLSASHSP